MAIGFALSLVAFVAIGALFFWLVPKWRWS
jgi:hypothetical protein